MTTTTTTTKASESYRHPTDLSGHGLRYFVSETGRHVVVWQLPAGETDRDVPEVFRHATVEAARETWRRLRDDLVRRGYVRE